MKIIAGLGNPGKKFEKTRHNVGFLVLETLKSKITNTKQKITDKSELPKFKFQKKFNAEILKLDARCYSLDVDLFLVKPQTFMNSSGKAVKKVLQFNNVIMRSPASNGAGKECNNLYVIHDDLDIPLGEYKIQLGKGPRDHGGINSIEHHLKTKGFWRIRVGIENRSIGNKANGEHYVLEKFSKKEREIIDSVIAEVIRELEIQRY